MTFTRLGIGFFGALRLLMTSKPRAVIGFGGYPTLPPIIAARTSGIPTAIHEQNAVMGRANRLLSRVVDRVALSFKPTKLLHADAEAKARLTGTPVRDAGAVLSRCPLRAAGAWRPAAAPRLRRQPRRALLLRGYAACA